MANLHISISCCHIYDELSNGLVLIYSGRVRWQPELWGVWITDYKDVDSCYSTSRWSCSIKCYDTGLRKRNSVIFKQFSILILIYVKGYVLIILTNKHATYNILLRSYVVTLQTDSVGDVSSEWIDSEEALGWIVSNHFIAYSSLIKNWHIS